MSGGEWRVVVEAAMAEIETSEMSDDRTDSGMISTMSRGRLTAPGVVRATMVVDYWCQADEWSCTAFSVESANRLRDGMWAI